MAPGVVAAAAADLRLTVLGAAGWAGALAGLLWSWWVTIPVAMGAIGLTVLRARRRGGSSSTVLGVALLFLAVAVNADLRAEQVRSNPVAALGRDSATVAVVLSVVSDPSLRSGAVSDYVVFRGRVTQATSGTVSHRVRAPVLVLAGPEWASVPLGATVRVSGRLGESRGGDVSALLRPRSDPDVVAGPAPWWRMADGVRASLRDSVQDVPESQRPLVPALVVGDDAGLDPKLAADFSTTGLTHLLAVSGTNLTLLLGFVLVVGRWVGVRGRWRYMLGAAAIVGFVLLARPEPSVLRAAVMGSVALVGLGEGGARRGARSLGVAVTALLLIDPWLALLPGFALSVLATAGIVFLAPGWRDALSTWLPRWLAEAVSVPAAAQLACTPVVAALAGEVSLVAVVTNLLASPAVGPATVLGLAGGLAGLLWDRLGRCIGTVAGWCVGWIAAVAERGAGLPTPSLPWTPTIVGLGLLTAMCVVAAMLTPRLLRRRGTCWLASLALAAVVLVGAPDPGWPPSGWLLAACDVGQGDALVLNAGAGRAVVVDVGPDPRTVGRCLDRLEVTEVPLLVLTHFHADHVDGLSGVLGELPVERLMVSPVVDPADTAAEVAALARSSNVSTATSPYGSTMHVGEVTLQVLWPPTDQATRGPGDGSTANDASIVLLARLRGIDLLLTGDIEPPAQAAVARLLPDLDVDVLKVPHHGSRYQDLSWLTSLGAEVAVVSGGADNDYGHPAPDTLTALAEAGVRLLRTDRQGDVAVLRRSGRLVTLARR